MFRVCLGIFRVCSGYVQSMFRASSVPIVDIFFNEFLKTLTIFYLSWQPANNKSVVISIMSPIVTNL